MLESNEGEVVFEKGHLVQVYRNDLAQSIGTGCKLMPMWSEPHRVLEQMLNSYKLEVLDGQQLEGEYHVRQLREFTPREGTELASQQREVETRRTREISNLNMKDLEMDKDSEECGRPRIENNNLNKE